MPEGVFGGLRVLDASQDIAGPFCGRLLADYGADVIKVEPPEGDPLRQHPPFYGKEPHREKSLLFLVLNLNKRGITLDVGTEAGRSLFCELVRSSDVLVESFRPGYLEERGLGYRDLAEVNPRLVVTSITPFGQTGPYSQYQGEEILYYALGGAMSISGTSDREPLKHGGFQAQYQAGLSAAAATAVAVLLQEAVGEGQYIDISIADCVAATMVDIQTSYAFCGGVPGRRHPRGSAFSSPMPCKDGWIVNQPWSGAGWELFAALYDRPELLEERFSDEAEREEHGEELDAIVGEAIAGKGRWELFHRAAGMRLPLGVVQDPCDLVACPQLESRGFFQQVEHPVMGNVRVPGALFNLHGAPYRLRRPAPLLGQHNREVYCGLLGLSREELTCLEALNVI